MKTLKAREGAGERPRGWIARAARVGLFPMLLAYVLVLAGSPVGQAGLLQLHLATADHEPAHPAQVELGQLPAAAARGPIAAPPSAHGEPHAHPVPAESAHESGTVHQHHAAHHHAGSVHHAHGAPHAQLDASQPLAAATKPAQTRTAAASAPHEHHGTVHTHEPRPVEDRALSPNGLSEFFLPLFFSFISAPHPPLSLAAGVLLAPHDVVRPPEVPPPRCSV